MNTYSTARERVEFGLETIPEDRMVSVSLRDLMFVHQTLGEFVQFFHQRMHYPTLSDVEEFLSPEDHSSGAFRVLADAYYKRMREMIPSDIDAAFDDGIRFEHPLPPKYFRDPDKI